MSTLLSQKLVATFKPTHTHVAGGEYEVLDFPRVKVNINPELSEWVNGVLYRNKDNLLCVRTAENFNARFKPL